MKSFTDGWTSSLVRCGADDDWVFVVVEVLWTWFEGDRSELDSVVFRVFV